MKTKRNNKSSKQRRRGIKAGTTIRKIQFSGTLAANGTTALSISIKSNVTVRVSSIKSITSSSAPTLTSIAIRGVDSEDELQSPIKMCTIIPKRTFIKQGRAVEAFTNTGTNTQHLGWIRNHGTVDLKYIVDIVYTMHDLEVTVSRNSNCNTIITNHIYDGDDFEAAKVDELEDKFKDIQI